VEYIDGCVTGSRVSELSRLLRMPCKYYTFTILQISDSLDSEESSLWTFESSMAECLHKILSSNDNLTVINHSK